MKNPSNQKQSLKALHKSRHGQQRCLYDCLYCGIKFNNSSNRLRHQTSFTRNNGVTIAVTVTNHFHSAGCWMATGRNTMALVKNKSVFVTKLLVLKKCVLLSTRIWISFNQIDHLVFKLTTELIFRALLISRLSENLCECIEYQVVFDG